MLPADYRRRAVGCISYLRRRPERRTV